MFTSFDELKVKDLVPDPDYSDSDTEEYKEETDEEAKMSPQSYRLTSATPSPHHRSRSPDITQLAITTDESGLIIPRKSPHITSKEKQNLHKELLFNQKIGKNVLGQKSELKKALDKFQDEHKKKELEQERISKKTLFERKLEDQANKLKLIETLQEKTTEELESQSEFQKMHAKVRAKSTAEVQP